MNPQRSENLFLQSAEIKGVYHKYWSKINIFKNKILALKTGAIQNHRTAESRRTLGMWIRFQGDRLWRLAGNRKPAEGPGWLGVRGKKGQEEAVVDIPPQVKTNTWVLVPGRERGPTPALQ